MWKPTNWSHARKASRFPLENCPKVEGRSPTYETTDGENWLMVGNAGGRRNEPGRSPDVTCPSDFRYPRVLGRTRWSLRYHALRRHPWAVAARRSERSCGETVGAGTSRLTSAGNAGHSS